jgi:hypothetical protein
MELAGDIIAPIKTEPIVTRAATKMQRSALTIGASFVFLLRVSSYCGTARAPGLVTDH